MAQAVAEHKMCAGVGFFCAVHVWKFGVSDYVLSRCGMRRNPPSRRSLMLSDGLIPAAALTYFCFDNQSGVCHPFSSLFLLSQVQSTHHCTSLSCPASLLCCLHCCATLPSSPPLAFPCKMRPSRDHGEAAGVPTPTGPSPSPMPQLPIPFTPTPPGPLRQLREKGHPEERSPPRRPQWQFHIMPCPSDAASSKGYTLWDVTGPLYRAGGIGSMVFFFIYFFYSWGGRRAERRGTKVLLNPLTLHCIQSPLFCQDTTPDLRPHLRKPC